MLNMAHLISDCFIGKREEVFLWTSVTLVQSITAAEILVVASVLSPKPCVLVHYILQCHNIVALICNNIKRFCMRFVIFNVKVKC